MCQIKSSGQKNNRTINVVQTRSVSESDSINDEFWPKTWLQSYFSSALGSGLLKQHQAIISKCGKMHIQQISGFVAFDL